MQAIRQLYLHNDFDQTHTAALRKNFYHSYENTRVLAFKHKTLAVNGLAKPTKKTEILSDRKGHSYNHNSLSYQRNVPFCIPKTARLNPEKTCLKRAKQPFVPRIHIPYRTTDRHSRTSGFSFTISNRHTSFIIFLLSWQFCCHPEKKQW